MFLGGQYLAQGQVDRVGQSGAVFIALSQMDVLGLALSQGFVPFDSLSLDLINRVLDADDLAVAEKEQHLRDKRTDEDVRIHLIKHFEPNPQVET